jgi:hypothetical protein
VCIGRWGRPSTGEIEAGLPDHGQAANLPWAIEPGVNDITISMQVNTPMEGLKVTRILTLDASSSSFTVSETVKNTNPLGRLYNVVQHPTIAAPFLDADTLINCNATTGFSCFGDDDLQRIAEWPKGICEDSTDINLVNPRKAYSSVFAFVTDKESEIGWLTAWSPTHNLVLGYLWKRADYPWISLWQDYDDNCKINCRGLEFGTTGIHKPFDEILAAGQTKVLGENTIAYIDAGQEIERSYCSFLLPVTADFKGIKQIILGDGNILIKPVQSEQMITLSTSYKF